MGPTISNSLDMPLFFMLIYYVDTLMSGLLSGMESRTELQKSLLEGSN